MRRDLRRKDRKITDIGWIEQLLNRGQALQLGMCSFDGWPYVVSMSYGYENGIIYLHGAAEGLKNEILRANPKVCFHVHVDTELKRAEIASNFSMYYSSVTGFGQLTTVTDLEEQNKALEALMRHYGGPHSPLTEPNGRLWIAKIDIEHMTGKSNPKPKAE